jgi:hypothetical protein
MKGVRRGAKGNGAVCWGRILAVKERSKFRARRVPQPNLTFLKPFAPRLRSERGRVSLPKTMNQPTSPFSPGPDFAARTPSHKNIPHTGFPPRPGTRSEKQTGKLRLGMTARAVLALAGLAFASCAHCPMCKHGEARSENRSGNRCENRCRDKACTGCGSRTEAKGPRATSGQATSGAAPEKRRAKAEPRSD